jgi:curli biogenesis system outer membrane secretion channel CsgG
MKKIVTYAVMLAYLTVTLYPHQVRAQQYDWGEDEAMPQQPYQQAAPAQVQQYQQSGKPKVAIYVSEYSNYSDEEKSALKSATISALVNSEQFQVVERSNIIEAELKKQASGEVDDDQLTAFGRQMGAQLVCVSDMIFLRSGSSQRIIGYYNGQPKTETIYRKYHQVSVRLIDVETAEIIGFGLGTVDISSGAQMAAAISSMVKKMLETMQPRADTNMPKMAVYVADASNRGRKESGALYSYTLEALFDRSRKLGNFRVVERSDAFTRQIDREQRTQRSGHVDDNQIARLGRQYGIGKIVIASIERFQNDYNVSSRVVNVETANVEKAAGPFTTTSELIGLDPISVKMVEQMMGLTEAEMNTRTIKAAKRAEYERKEKVEGTVMAVVLLVGIVGFFVWLGVGNKKNNETVSVK